MQLSVRDLVDHGDLQVLSAGHGSTTATPQHPSADPTTKPPDYHEVMEKPPTYEQAITSFQSVQSDSSLPPYTASFDQLNSWSYEDGGASSQPHQSATVQSLKSEYSDTVTPAAKTINTSNSLPSFTGISAKLSFDQREVVSNTVQQENVCFINASSSYSSPKNPTCSAGDEQTSIAGRHETGGFQSLGMFLDSCSQAVMSPHSSGTASSHLCRSLGDVHRQPPLQSRNSTNSSSDPSLTADSTH